MLPTAGSFLMHTGTGNSDQIVIICRKWFEIGSIHTKLLLLLPHSSYGRALSQVVSLPHHSPPPHQVSNKYSLPTITSHHGKAYQLVLKKSGNFSTVVLPKISNRRDKRTSPSKNRPLRSFMLKYQFIYIVENASKFNFCTKSLDICY